MHFVVFKRHFVCSAFVEDGIDFVPLTVEVRIHNSKVAENAVLPRFDAHLSVAENEVIFVVGHTADGPNVLRVFFGVVFKSVQGVHLLSIEGNDECLLLHGPRFLEFARVIARNQCLLSLNYQH